MSHTPKTQADIGRVPLTTGFGEGCSVRMNWGKQLGGKVETRPRLVASQMPGLVASTLVVLATIPTNSHPMVREEAAGEFVMAIKNVVVPVEIEYLQEAAKKRGISRTKLVQVVMQKVVEDKLVTEILDDDDQPRQEPRQPRYRRFRNRNAD